VSTQALTSAIKAMANDSLTVLLEISGQEVGYESARPDGAGITLHDATAILEPAGSYLTRVEFLRLEGQVVIAHFLDTGSFSGYSRAGLAAGVEVCGDTKVFVVRCLRVFPHAEEVQFAADLLTPLTVVMRGQGKRRVGLGRLMPVPAR